MQRELVMSSSQNEINPTSRTRALDIEWLRGLILEINVPKIAETKSKRIIISSARLLRNEQRLESQYLGATTHWPGFQIRYSMARLSILSERGTTGRELHN